MIFKALDVLLNPDKIIPHYLKRKVSAFDLPPVSVELHWTSNCNYDCTHCSYGSRRKSTNYLSNEIVTNLVDELIQMNCQAVYLSGGGEPTVLKLWSDYAGKLISSDVEVALISNGVVLNDKTLPVVRKMSYVAISVYSTREDRYRNITGSRFFDQQFKSANKIKSESTSTIVGARCVLNETNFDELFEIYDKTISSGFDYIIFIPAVDYENRGLLLKQEWVDRVILDINNNLDYFDHSRTNVKSLLQKMVSHYELYSYLEDLKEETHGCDCIHIRTSAFVNYDGGVYLCQPDIGNTNLQIGNVNETTFKEIWNSERHHQVIDQLDDRWNKGSCKNCRSISFNKAIELSGASIVNLESIPYDPFL